MLSPVPSEAAVTRLFSSIRYFIGVQYPELMSKTDHLTSRYWTLIELLIGTKSDRSNAALHGVLLPSPKNKELASTQEVGYCYTSAKTSCNFTSSYFKTELLLLDALLRRLGQGLLLWQKCGIPVISNREKTFSNIKGGGRSFADARSLKTGYWSLRVVEYLWY